MHARRATHLAWPAFLWSAMDGDSLVRKDLPQPVWRLLQADFFRYAKIGQGMGDLKLLAKL